MKRVVTGRDAAGKSVFLREDEPPKHARLAGTLNEITEVWGTEDVPTIPVRGGDPTIAPHPIFPSPGGTCFVIVRVAPDAEAERVAASGVDMAAAANEFFGQFPGLGEVMEPDSPGMHTSKTIDYIVVLSGEVDLELDAGETRRLRAGDCVVQNATRHAWRNSGSVDCVMAAVIVGARQIE